MARALAPIVPLRRRGTDVADLSDDALIAACATGDPVARRALFEHHVDAIHRFLRRMWRGNDEAIADLLQTTFLSAYDSLSRFRAGGRVRPWLYGIAANVVRAHGRREGRRLRALAAIASWFRDEPSTTLEPWDRERLARLPDALLALPHDLRAAVVLVDLEGQSAREAAFALDVPEGTIWRRVFHGRRRLRELVEESGR